MVLEIGEILAESLEKIRELAEKVFPQTLEERYTDAKEAVRKRAKEAIKAAAVNGVNSGLTKEEVAQVFAATIEKEEARKEEEKQQSAKDEAPIRKLRLVMTIQKRMEAAIEDLAAAVVKGLEADVGQKNLTETFATAIGVELPIAEKENLTETFATAIGVELPIAEKEKLRAKIGRVLRKLALFCLAILVWATLAEITIPFFVDNQTFSQIFWRMPGSFREGVVILVVAGLVTLFFWLLWSPPSGFSKTNQLFSKASLLGLTLGLPIGGLTGKVVSLGLEKSGAWEIASEWINQALATLPTLLS